MGVPRFSRFSVSRTRMVQQMFVTPLLMPSFGRLLLRKERVFTAISVTDMSCHSTLFMEVCYCCIVFVLKLGLSPLLVDVIVLSPGATGSLEAFGADSVLSLAHNVGLSLFLAYDSCTGAEHWRYWIVGGL